MSGPWRDWPDDLPPSKPMTAPEYHEHVAGDRHAHAYNGPHSHGGVSALTAPETAAGRALLGRLWAVNEYSQASRIIATVQVDIRAIEAEARAAALGDYRRNYDRGKALQARAKALDDVAALVAEAEPDDADRPGDPTDESWEGGWYAGRDAVLRHRRAARQEGE